MGVCRKGKSLGGQEGIWWVIVSSWILKKEVEEWRRMGAGLMVWKCWLLNAPRILPCRAEALSFPAIGMLMTDS